MQTLALSTLLFHTIGTLAMLVGMAVKSCLPVRHAARTWELVENADLPHAA
jgi:hypothetical protein